MGAPAARRMAELVLARSASLFALKGSRLPAALQEVPMSADRVSQTEFTGIRIRVDTDLTVGQLAQRLRDRMGRADLVELGRLAREAASAEEFAREVETRFVGESGFMLFAEFDHGAWLARFGIRRQVLRWILGNPLIAVTMLRHDVTAGLFAPVEILLTDRPGEGGSSVTYLKPSTLMGSNPAVLEAARALDLKLDSFITRAANP
jgi:uncharacterized protein (DUF302 family)